jgi:hypothetical protein
MDDRYSRYGPRDYYSRYSPDDFTRDFGSGRDYTYSGAREYAAAGELGYGGRPRGRGWRDDNDWNERARGGWDRERPDPYRGSATDQRYYGGGRNYDRGRAGYGKDRGFLDRAGDEVRSWFGDEEAERRREMDQRYDERTGRYERIFGGTGDGHYQAWRRQRIAELDRDYDEYQRENSKRFENEFGSWRAERSSQRDSLRRVIEHMEVLGLDGSHVGTVDKVRGDRILLTKSDSDAGGHHHSIPSRWIQSVDDKVTLRMTADEAKAHWRDEEHSSALFGESRDDREDWSTEHNLNRSFSGTY